MHVYRILVCRRGFGDYHFTRKSALSPPLHCHLLPKVAFQTSDGLHRERSVRLAGLPAAVEAAFANVSFNIAGSEVSYYGPGAGESGQKGNLLRKARQNECRREDTRRLRQVQPENSSSACVGVKPLKGRPGIAIPAP